VSRKRCYFQGCQENAVTKEHVPPKAFFPQGKRDNLLTVSSCEAHNNAKSGDDLYVLAQICMNTSPANESREIFFKTVLPQLGFNEARLGKMIVQDAIPLPGGAVVYRVDGERFDRFFTALSCGIIYKSAKDSLPAGYSIAHVYHSLHAENPSPKQERLHDLLARMYHEGGMDAVDILDFGQVETINETVYTARVFGVPNFGGSITVAHQFFGTFRVTSMLSRVWSDTGPSLPDSAEE
jgi:hypothetical protein